MARGPLVISVRKYLASHHMFADEEWLSGFVEYLIENNDGHYKENEVQILAKEQWLLNDLKDICPGCLPINLKSQHKTTLKGRFVLQINASVDIGTSAYQQYLKLQKVNTENVEATINTEDKVLSHRMIKLYLTDGVQDVTAIEYKPMRNLSCDITPGCKLLLKAQENISCTNRSTSNNLSHPPPSAENFTPKDNHNNAQASDLFVADDDIDIEQIAAIEAHFMENSNKRSLNDNNSRPEKKAKTNPVEINNVDDYPDNDDLMMEDEDYLREMEAHFDAQEEEISRCVDRGPILCPAEPFVYIKQINELPEQERAGKVFKVKGQIIKLLSKLSVGKDGWSLKCAIVDGTGSLNVDFTSEVLSKLVGITPTEMNHIKKQMATKPELKEKAVSALKKAKESLQILYCIIELTMLDGPKITQLIPFDTTHVEFLKRRQDTR